MAIAVTIIGAVLLLLLIGAVSYCSRHGSCSSTPRVSVIVEDPPFVSPGIIQSFEYDDAYRPTAQALHIHTMYDIPGHFRDAFRETPPDINESPIRIRENSGVFFDNPANIRESPSKSRENPGGFRESPLGLREGRGTFRFFKNPIPAPSPDPPAPPVNNTAPSTAIAAAPFEYPD